MIASSRQRQLRSDSAVLSGKGVRWASVFTVGIVDRLATAGITRADVQHVLGISPSTVARHAAALPAGTDQTARDLRVPLAPDRLRPMLNQGMSAAAIGRDVGCSTTAVLDAVRRAGLEPAGQTTRGRRRPDWTGVLTDQMLHDAYVTDARSAEDIAAEVGCSPSTVIRALTRHSIPRRPGGGGSHYGRGGGGNSIAEAHLIRGSQSGAARRRRADGDARGVGAPVSPIDWPWVDRLRAAGVSVAEIAEEIGMSRSQLYRQLAKRT